LQDTLHNYSKTAAQISSSYLYLLMNYGFYNHAHTPYALYSETVLNKDLAIREIWIKRETFTGRRIQTSSACYQTEPACDVSVVCRFYCI